MENPGGEEEDEEDVLLAAAVPRRRGNSRGIQEQLRIFLSIFNETWKYRISHGAVVVVV